MEFQNRVYDVQYLFGQELDLWPGWVQLPLLQVTHEPVHPLQHPDLSTAQSVVVEEGMWIYIFNIFF